MKILTFSTYKLVTYMGQQIEVPLWVRYLAIQPRAYSNNADLIGTTYKPIIGAKKPKFYVHKDGRMEIIGAVTNCTIKTSSEANLTIWKLPE